MIDFTKQDKKWFNEKYCLEAVQQNRYALRYVKNQTEQICLKAVQQNGLTLLYVNNQTIDICLSAVQQNGNALQYVNNQTPKIVYYALEQNPDLDPDLIKITEQEWNEFKDQNPELFI